LNCKEIDLSKLPRKQFGNKQCIDWKNSAGSKIDFVYDDMHGTIEIVEYIKNKKVKIKYGDIYKDYNTDMLLECKIDTLIGKFNREFIYKVGDVVKDNRRNLTIIDVTKMKRNNHNAKYVKYKCNVCNYESDYILENTFIQRERGCSRCAGRKTFIGYNDIVSTNNLWMIPYFIGGEDEAKQYTPQSGKKVNLQCPDCGHNKIYKISELFNKHSIACKCGDGISYPEKFMACVLDQLNIDYIWHYQSDWLIDEYGSKRIFDFKIGNLIIEIDGTLGHGKKIHARSNMTIEESLRIDEWKDEQANLNNFTVIRISADKSEIIYLKTNIIKALNDKFDLSNIDWQLCGEYALKNIIKEICEYYELNKSKGTSELVKKFKISNGTIIRYLKSGSEIGWCTYDANTSIKIGKNNSSQTIKNRSIELNKKVHEYYNNNMSIQEISDKLNIHLATVKRHLKIDKTNCNLTN